MLSAGGRRVSSQTVEDIEGIYRCALYAGAREVFVQSWARTPGMLVMRGYDVRALREVVVVVNRVASRAGQHGMIGTQAASWAGGTDGTVARLGAPGRPADPAVTVVTP
jgi:hypothetical protein